MGRGENIGFGAGVNRGAEHSNAAYLAIVNPDCVVAQDALSVLRDEMCSLPGAVAAGGLLLNQDGTEQEGGRRRQPTLLDAVARRLRLHQLPYIGGRFNFNDAGRPLPSGHSVVSGLSGAPRSRSWVSAAAWSLR
ncbi:MAG: glycosyltransferase [Planctomycetes bacterium]|nr:glycosyltransferase [Planctomycetota bacterium]